MKFLIHLHLFYLEQAGDLARRAAIVKKYGGADLFCTMHAHDESAKAAVREYFPDARFIIVKNVGADVWPFISVLNEVNLDKYDYLIKIHTKRTFPRHDKLVSGFDKFGSNWREYLLSFLEPENFAKAISAFQDDPRLGMVADFRCLEKDTEQNPRNLDLARTSLEYMNKNGIFPKNGLDYVAGTMFIARAKCFVPIKDLNSEEYEFCEFISDKGRQSLAHLGERALGGAVKHFDLEIRDVYSNNPVNSLTTGEQIIFNSPLFDGANYAEKYGLANAAAAARDYFNCGWRAGRNPSKKFDTNAYLAVHSDILRHNMNPLWHYEGYGRNEKRQIFDAFSQKKCKKHKIVCYSCISGGYDAFPMHRHFNRNWDYVLFSDNLELLRIGRAGHWEIRPMRFQNENDVKNARWHKCHPHILFPEYKYSLWLDSNINVVSGFLSRCIRKRIILGNLISVQNHPNKRKDIYDEAHVLKTSLKDERVQFDRGDKVNKVIQNLRDAGYPENGGVHETNMIFRRHNNPRIIQMNNEWWDKIVNWSHRDQLSFDFIIWKNKIKLSPITSHNIRNDENNFVIQRHVSIKNWDFVKECRTMTIIIPFYNDMKYGPALLKSLVDTGLSENVNVIIMDDHGDFETEQMLKNFVESRKASGDIKYALIRNERNLQFVHTCNRAMKLAHAGGGGGGYRFAFKF